MKKNKLFFIGLLMILIIGIIVGCNREPVDTPDITPGETQAVSLSPSAEATPAETPAATPDVTPESTAEPTEPDATLAPTPKPTPTPTAKPTPTPTAKPNDPTVVFSHEGGVYTSPFELTLSSQPGYTIYYTTDGSDPRSSTTRITYTKPISIKNSMNSNPGPVTTATSQAFNLPDPRTQIIGKSIKAVAVKNGVATPVVINSYYVGSRMMEKYDMPVVSITTKMDDFTTDTGIYVSVMQHPFATKERIVVFVEMFDEKGVKQSGQYVELCMSGNGSLGNHMKSMRLYFKKGAESSVTDNPGKLKYDIFEGNAKDVNGDVIDSFDRIILRNSGNDCTETMFRDAFIQKASEPLVVDYMESRPILVFVNGECWGMYNARERYDDKYFNAHYGVSEENIVMLEAPSPLVTGNNNSPFELKEGVDGDEKAWEDLLDYASTHNLAVQSSFDYVAARVDIASMMDYFIANMYFGNGDWPGNNVKVWRNKNPEDPSGLDTKWRFVLLDLDFGCGSEYQSNTVANALAADAVITRLFNACLKNEEFKQSFYDRFVYVMENYYNEDVLIPLVDKMAEERKNGININASRWTVSGTSLSKFESEVEEMRTFLRNRTKYVKQYLVSKLNITATEVTVNYMSETTTVMMNGGSVKSGYTKECSKNEVVTLTATVKSGYTFKGFAVTFADGTQKIYDTKTVEITVKSRVTATVLATKNKTTTPRIVTASSTIFYLAENGNLYAWGDNTQNQCGVVTSSLLKKALIATNVKDIATSQGGNVGAAPHTLILTHDGVVYSFGNNSNGQLGRTGDNFAILPVSLPSVDSEVVDISAGHDHTLILFANGDLYGVGNNTNGQLGTKNLGTAVNTFVKLASNVTSMAAGRRHSLFVIDDVAYGIGDNRWLKLTNSSQEVFTSPVKLLDNAKEVIAGEHSSFIIDNNNDLYYIGWRSSVSYVTGQGDGKVHKLLSNVKSVSMQDEHALIVTNDNKCYGVGLNSYGQVKAGSTSTQSTPVIIASDVISAGAGSWFSVMLKDNGEIIVWGKNTAAIKGDGIASDSTGKTTITVG